LGITAVPYAELTAVLGCVLLSILFSGSETALNALGSTKLEKLQERLRIDERRHRFLEIWADQRNGALTCILIGNNIVNITASALATVAFEKMFAGSAMASMAVLVAIFFTTFLILTFGEIIPKTFAQNNPERFVAITRIMYPFWVVLRPVTWLFTRLSVWVIMRSGGSIVPGEDVVTEEDIEDNIERAAEQGNLDEEQAKLLSSVIDFDEIIVHEVMRPRTDVVGIPTKATLPEVLATVEESNYSRYPVYGEDLDDIVGVLYIRDLLSWFAKPRDAELNLVERIRPPWVIPESKNIADTLREMQQERTHMAIVVDEHGGTAGIITVEDIIEEVFGEIYDEYDDADDTDGEDLVLEVGEGAWDVQARISCRDLEDAIDIEFPEDDRYSTVAGYIVTELGDIPDVGSHVRMSDYLFTVLEAEPTRVIRVRIEASPLVEEPAPMEHTG